MERYRALIGAALALYAAGSVWSGLRLAHIAIDAPRLPVTAVDERAAAALGFTPVELHRPDGVDLRAWLLWPQGASDAVILLHGIADNRTGMLGYAQWLARNGYAVLLPDVRGQGASGGVVSYGLLEDGDIHAWLDLLAAVHPLRCVYGLGESLGAAELLESLPGEHRFCAVAAEDSFATFREVAYLRVGQQFGTGPWLGRTLFAPAIQLGYWSIRAKYGLSLEDASPARAVEGIDTPVLLIEDLNDRNIPPYHSEEIQSHNPRVTLWKVPGAGHIEAYATTPKEFERRVLNWFRSHASPAEAGASAAHTSAGMSR